jgi:hypothetical protein
LALPSTTVSRRASTPGEPNKHVFPRVQVIPQPDDQASFQVEGVEKLRYHCAPRTIRPFWFPLIGPAGHSLTRITHPRDPNSHSHHKSIWVAHNSVNGLNFWSDNTRTRIAHDIVVTYEDGPDSATMVVRNHWLDGDGRRLLTETRSTRLIPLADGELFVDIDLNLDAQNGPVTFGKTPFGFLGVRVAKTMGIHDGGGTIRNSEGAEGEKAIIWKRARWVDYSGPIAPGEKNGITLMDHPSNPRHPTYFHVRGDGWMGASFSYAEDYVLQKGESLALRYRLYANRHRAALERIDAAWRRYAAQR